jgi:hypothetical protein
MISNDETTRLLPSKAARPTVITAEVVEEIRQPNKTEPTTGKESSSSALIRYPEPDSCFQWLLATALTASK